MYTCVCIHISTSIYNPLLKFCLTSPSGQQLTALASGLPAPSSRGGGSALHSQPEAWLQS